MPRSPVCFDLMRRLPKGVDTNSLPDLAHYRGHGHRPAHRPVPDAILLAQRTVTFEELTAHGARETTKLLAIKSRLKCSRCGGQYADRRIVRSSAADRLRGHRPEKVVLPSGVAAVYKL